MISIFAKPPFLRTTETGTHVVRISSRSRGEEIADYIGAEYNTERTDVNIYVKPRQLDALKDGDYVDILDDMNLIPMLKKRPGIKVITMSQIQHEYLQSELKNDLHLIHHHHINIEGVRNTKHKLIGGFIGHSSHAKKLLAEIQAVLDVEILPIFHYTTRQDSIDWFQKIDFLIAWNSEQYEHYPFSHPTKLINAAAFGIPSISQPIDGYKEFNGYYLPITGLESLTEAVEELKDPTYYKVWSDKVFEEAQKYYIGRIAEKYYDLR